MKTIKSSLVATAVIATLAAPAFAADVTIYGRAHLSADHLDNGDDSAIKVSSNSSRLGFKASTKLENGLEALVQVEQEVFFNDGSGSWTSRDSFVGLKGDFGLVRLGKFDTPHKIIRSRTDMFGDRVGDARNITRQAGAFDERFNQSIHYQSPSFNGVTFDFVYSAETAQSTEASNDTNQISTSVTYTAKGLYLAAAYESRGDFALIDGELKDSKSLRLGAYYDISSAFRVAALYQSISDVAGGDRDVYGIGASYKMGEYTLRGQYYVAGDNDTDDTGAGMLAVGIDRSLGKDLTLYAVYGITSNDDNAAFNIAHQARSSRLGPVVGEDISGLSLGIIYNF
ncbi:porin [Chromatiaceae bacterium AAb-1]|nr:porin [Chromatiaceae bacterium AAb-1]